MKIGRSIIIGAILTFGAAGPILAGSAVPAVAAATASAVPVAAAPATHFYV